MARSPLTLAATVTSALPQAAVVAVRSLTEGAGGRYDSAAADLDDGRRVVVRVAVDADASADLAAETRALRALTPGVRRLLPFRAPELLGETSLGPDRVLVVDLLDGYRVDAAHIPAGRGVATSIGSALAALHALPVSIVRTEGLPVRTPAQARDEITRLIDRVEGTRRAPAALIARWRRAVTAEELWRFESAVILGGASAASFLLDEIDDAPGVVGVLEWHGLQVGDPAIDLQWLAGAPEAADDVFEAYGSASGRAPDSLLRERARMYAELEFARWLMHGVESGDESIVADAVDLLESLATGVGHDDVVPRASSSVDEALALLDRTPQAPASPVDTSMHTDTYDPEELSAWLADDAEDSTDPTGTPSSDESVPPVPVEAVDETGTDAERWSDLTFAETAPLTDDDLPPRTPAPITEADLPSRRDVANDVAGSDAARRAATRTAEGPDDEAEAQRASDAALRRWLAD
ncbi:aminoglycoside phosphotransferase [Microbacterium sp. SSW1-59]|uniref:phosphotransferase n=1 Tax=Microbacterium xanthum TaxID=3079794 RepID=UPI002AD4B972|nr:phosphotransferase [Microbacterium sp. SSW1-59]MDZ8202130.1 aminoglycoside phosphotransferase [Microbacterium sp. SSW1-59]